MEKLSDKGKNGEEYVNQIAYSTFAKYWCYPNPHDENGDNKEIADLLILFKESCIIISVKNYEFKGNHERYFRKTIEKAIKQTHGAEKKLFKSNRDIYIRHPIKGKEKFKKDKYTTIVRLIVNLGEGEEYSPLLAKTRSDHNVSILHKHTVDVLFKELDTISDFVHYFKEREKLAQIKTVFVLGSELDLLALYLFNERSFHKHLKKNISGLILEIEGKWLEYSSHKKVVSKKQADKDSYFIDEIVKRYILKRKNGYILAEYLMSYNRLFRRAIAFPFLDLFRKYENSDRSLLVVKRYFEIKKDVFLFMYFSSEFDEKEIYKLMDIAAFGFAIEKKYNMEKIIIIAAKSKIEQLFTGLIKIYPLSKKEEEDYIHNLKVLNWFNNFEYIPYNAKEYPD